MTDRPSGVRGDDPPESDGRVAPHAHGAVPVPPLLPGQPPLAILVDYDGTIARTDVSDEIMRPFVTAEWGDLGRRYDDGLIGSRWLMEWEAGLIRAERDELAAIAAAQPHDPGFAPFARRAQAAEIPIEVVSDGFGFFIAPALDSLGVGEIPVVTALTTFGRDGRPSMAFPNGHPTCFVCGTCKRNRVLAHQASGRAVVFIGNGASDRYAAGYADLVWATDPLTTLCELNGWPYRAWTEFAEIDAWLAATLEAWQADPATLRGPAARPLFCGPEVWGPGRWDPPAPAGGPAPSDESEGTVPG
jgi:HAD superfamily phosphoserine phosphatase-like hydrolase